jgi:hypothetical protein
VIERGGSLEKMPGRRVGDGARAVEGVGPRREVRAQRQAVTEAVVGVENRVLMRGTADRVEGATDVPGGSDVPSMSNAHVWMAARSMAISRSKSAVTTRRPRCVGTDSCQSETSVPGSGIRR